MDLGELGARIKKRREARGLRQADLASALRVTPQAVSKWERGENAPDIVLLVPLSRLLDVSVEWLLGGSPIERETFEAVVMVTTVRGYAERSQAESPRALAAWINGLHHTDISRVLRTGVDKDGHTLCPPMPFGPMGGFAGLTDADATAIADYLLHLPAMPNSVPGECFAPGAP